MEVESTATKVTYPTEEEEEEEEYDDGTETEEYKKLQLNFDRVALFEIYRSDASLLQNVADLCLEPAASVGVKK